MIQFLNRNAANAPNTIQNHTLLFINENGQLTTKDEFGNIQTISPLQGGWGFSPRRNQMQPNKAIIHTNPFTGTQTSHFEKYTTWASANDKRDRFTIIANQFAIENLTNLYTPFIRGYIAESQISNAVFNQIIGDCANAAIQIYVQGVPNQTLLIGSDENTNNRHVHELCIDVLLNMAHHFDPTTQLVNAPITKPDLYYFDYDQNATTTYVENDHPNEFTNDGSFATPQQRAFLGKIIHAIADLLNQLYDAHDFLTAVPTTPENPENRDSGYIATTFNTLIL